LYIPISVNVTVADERAARAICPTSQRGAGSCKFETGIGTQAKGGRNPAGGDHQVRW
jgi:hypothetical protein